MGKKNLTLVIDDAYKVFLDERFVVIFEFTEFTLIIKYSELIGLNHYVGLLKDEKWYLVRTKLTSFFLINKLKVDV